jgi:hypothetical protein
LPPNIHLLTFLPEYTSSSKNKISSSNSILLRLEHFYELNEDSVLSMPVTLDLNLIFGNIFNIISVEELALGANMNVSELNDRLKWNSSQNEIQITKLSGKLPGNEKTKSQSNVFTFNPMQIRTFRIKYIN